MSKRFIVGVVNPGETPADNGRTIHALKLAGELKDGGAEVMVLFHGQGITWLPRFINRTADSHPFVRNYGYAFDQVQDEVHACNMCCKRFASREAIEALEVRIHGEGSDHMNLGALLLDGWQLINY